MIIISFLYISVCLAADFVCLSDYLVPNHDNGWRTFDGCQNETMIEIKISVDRKKSKKA
jgi:hypothetical protein